MLDVPQPDGHDIIGNRAYAREVAQIMALARAHMTGIMDGGVFCRSSSTFPAMAAPGPTATWSCRWSPRTRAELEAVDFPPFAALADAPMAMTAHVVYTAFDKDAPATLVEEGHPLGDPQDRSASAACLMSDDLSMNALKGSLSERAARALEAGCDMLLHCNGHLTEMEEVARAAGALKGKALSRARRALKAVAPPPTLRQAAALKDLERLATA